MVTESQQYVGSHLGIIFQQIHYEAIFLRISGSKRVKQRVLRGILTLAHSHHELWVESSAPLDEMSEPATKITIAPMEIKITVKDLMHTPIYDAVYFRPRAATRLSRKRRIPYMIATRRPAPGHTGRIARS